jgi:hypothetical protein
MVIGLTNGTSYVFRVAAINSSGTGTYSTPSTAVTPGTPPGAPTGLTAVAGPGSVTLSWTAPADSGSSAITGYSVQRSRDSGTTWSASTKLRDAAVGHDAPATTKTVTGLTNGVSYVFRVAAINATGVGAYSTTSTPVTPTGHDAHLTLGGAHPVDAGKHLTLSTTLTDATTLAPIANATVELLARHGSSPWMSMGTVLTDVAGHAQDQVKPGRNTRYQWRFAGDATRGTAASAVRNVTVRQVVTAKVTSHHVGHGGTVTIYGTVRPTANGSVVHLQQKKNGSWHTLAAHAKIARRALPDGTHRAGFVINLTVKHKGTHHYRVHRPATGKNGAGNSATLTVRGT